MFTKTRFQLTDLISVNDVTTTNLPVVMRTIISTTDLHLLYNY